MDIVDRLLRSAATKRYNKRDCEYAAQSIQILRALCHVLQEDNKRLDGEFQKLRLWLKKHKDD